MALSDKFLLNLTFILNAKSYPIFCFKELVNIF